MLTAILILVATNLAITLTVGFVLALGLDDILARLSTLDPADDDNE